MMTTDIKSIKKIEDEEIDLISLAKTFWKGKRILFKSVIVFGIIGFIVAIFSPKEYVAKTVMVPQVGDGQSKLGGLSSLAAMAGFNLNTGSSGSELSPTLYPQIINSIPFQLELMNTPLNFSDSPNPITLYDYYTGEHQFTFGEYLKKYTIGLPGTLMSSVKGQPSGINPSSGRNVNNPIRLSQKEIYIRNYLSTCISLEVNAKDGYLSLSAKMKEPSPAAQLAQRAQELLQQYIIEFKIKKTKQNLDFIQQRFNEAAKEYELAQSKLAGYQDRNKNVTLATVSTEQAKLQTQFNLISGVYTELGKQLEQAKIQVKQDTPVFTIIEPVSVPTQRSKPIRSLILLIWLFFGGSVGTGIIFGKEYLVRIKERWDE
jgi:LPS O-antigen subunit length determinant protein (WzzB/FepE family)